jgi:hypothetical protein
MKLLDYRIWQPLAWVHVAFDSREWGLGLSVSRHEGLCAGIHLGPLWIVVG